MFLIVSMIEMLINIEKDFLKLPHLSQKTFNQKIFFSEKTFFKA
jgi:hypothetical protein